MSRLLKRLVFAIVLCITAAPVGALGSPQSTRTILSIEPDTVVVSGTVVTLRATVTSASAQTGMVMFCNASAPFCEDSAVLGTATAVRTSATQLSATMRFRPGVGAYSINAVFLPTSLNLRSTSTAELLTVAPSSIYSSTTTLTASGDASNPTLSGTVTAFGNQTLLGSIAFLDTSNSNVQLGSAALDDTGTTFASAISYPTGTGPYSVAVGDFNRDGIPDLAIANFGGGATVSVLLGKGDGTFQSQVTYPTGSGPSAVAVGDFNGDGIPDLAVPNSSSHTVSVLLGKGDGTFQAQVTYATGSTPCFVVVDDFNGDGIPDLAVANSGSSTVSVLLGNGDGTFQAQIPYATGKAPYSVGVGDFNGDGIPDLAVANSGSSTVSVLLGNGDGTFQAQLTYATGKSPYSVAVGDFNGDGIPDLAVTNFQSSTLSVLLGNGDGTFQSQVTYATGSLAYSVAVGDFNGDGIPDLAVANYIANTVSVRFGQQTAEYSLRGLSIVGSGSHNVLASFSGDSSRLGSQSTPVSLTASPATTIVTLSASPNPIIYGSILTIAASLTTVDGIEPTGTITLQDNGTTLGSSVISGGTAGFTTLSLSVGAHRLTAVYSGDINYAESTSSVLNEVVNKASAGLNLISSANPSIFGTPLTLKATVIPGATGTVTFLDGATTLGSVPINSGSASLTIPTPTAGSHVISAIYSGDDNYQ